jgi:RNA:NAD 2'-phosphotransferase (TPT1/KptA family)
VAACAAYGTAIARDELEYVVAHNDKKRFAISEDGQ